MSLIGFPLLLIPFAIYNIIAFLLLFVELLKSTRIGTRNVVDHGLSFLLFVAMTVEFILVRQAASSTFFILLIISFVDVLGGFSVSLRSAQRDFTVESGAHIVPPP